MGKLVSLTRKDERRHVTALPLVPCEDRPAPAWRLERLGEDRFRLTMAAAGFAADDIAVFIEDGLLHIEGARAGQRDGAIDCAFLLLEPLTIVRVELRDGELMVELERNRATPCLAVPPPVRREGVEALALAA